ncbi:hypothetical protein CEUSTIGMA_g6065.t1 [Chlamydomonas eustigma]|uniref:YqgF/RNase H-like domain-containing protein n=1 Tax=Chlamydomonas eustigma TaxID=1157962 RepID=A0A250X6F4_9CHLO|nr:hypothetical protein CEUSTIGMA_g6065.t1 [Chlamydomonas eustigma]|eukprot:GAX78626.1 hypothetical protein CEUSTIGMA_g6065.t1 [Chlamydomonas eustigma]
MLLHAACYISLRPDKGSLQTVRSQPDSNFSAHEYKQPEKLYVQSRELLKKPQRLSPDNVFAKIDGQGPTPLSSKQALPVQEKQYGGAPSVSPKHKRRTSGISTTQKNAKVSCSNSSSAGAIPTTTATRAPPAMQVLGVDYGRKWTGLAVGVNTSCDPLKVIPSGDSMSSLAQELMKLCVERGLKGIVVGLPLNPMLKGKLTDPNTDTPMAKRCRSLANTLALLAPSKNIEVYIYDEASTSLDARRIMGVKDSKVREDGFTSTKDKKENQEDSLSAMILVRRYLNCPGRAVRVKLRTSMNKRGGAISSDDVFSPSPAAVLAGIVDPQSVAPTSALITGSEDTTNVTVTAPTVTAPSATAPTVTAPTATAPTGTVDSAVAPDAVLNGSVDPAGAPPATALTGCVVASLAVTPTSHVASTSS